MLVELRPEGPGEVRVDVGEVGPLVGVAGEVVEGAVDEVVGDVARVVGLEVGLLRRRDGVVGVVVVDDELPVVDADRAGELAAGDAVVDAVEELGARGVGELADRVPVVGAGDLGAEERRGRLDGADVFRQAPASSAGRIVCVRLGKGMATRRPP